MAPETDIMGQFLGPETDTFCQFMAPIVFPRILINRKTKNNLNIIWIMYEFNRNKKNLFEQKLAHFTVFWIQKLTECVSFWAQKLTLWAKDTISQNDRETRIATFELSCD